MSVLVPVELLRGGVAVEKVQFPPKHPKIGGYKMPRKLERSFLGHPSAKFFRPFSSEGLFQHPLLQPLHPKYVLVWLAVGCVLGLCLELLN